MKIFFRIRRWSLRFSILRVKGDTFDLFFFIEAGYGLLSGYFDTKGLFFYVDALRFNQTDTGYTGAKGFKIALTRDKYAH
jgi:hypothetical protein